MSLSLMSEHHMLEFDLFKIDSKYLSIALRIQA